MNSHSYIATPEPNKRVKRFFADFEKTFSINGKKDLCEVALVDDNANLVFHSFINNGRKYEEITDHFIGIHFYH